MAPSGSDEDDEFGPFEVDQANASARMKVLKVSEVAERLRVSSSTIYNLVEEGRIACYRIGMGRGSIRFSEEQVEAFLQSSRVEPGTLKPGFQFTHSRSTANRSSAPPS